MRQNEPLLLQDILKLLIYFSDKGCGFVRDDKVKVNKNKLNLKLFGPRK